MPVLGHQSPFSNVGAVMDLPIIVEIQYMRQLPVTVLGMIIVDRFDFQDILDIVGTSDIGGE